MPTRNTTYLLAVVAMTVLVLTYLVQNLDSLGLDKAPGGLITGLSLSSMARVVSQMGSLNASEIRFNVTEEVEAEVLISALSKVVMMPIGAPVNKSCLPAKLRGISCVA